MNIRELREIYDVNPSDWVVVFNYGIQWYISHKPQWIPEYIYKLINIKHKNILEAYLADNSVYIERYRENSHMIGFFKEENFIENYNPKLEYRLKYTKQDFNGGYIVASEESYQFLIEANYTSDCEDCTWESYNNVFDAYFVVKNGVVDNATYDMKFTSVTKPLNSMQQFYINKGKLSWTKPDLEYRLRDTKGWDDFEVNPAFQRSFNTEEKEDGMDAYNNINNSTDGKYNISNCNTKENGKIKEKEDGGNICNNTTIDTSNISGGTKHSKQLNNFESYGFTADFEGEILRDNGRFLIGYIVDSVGEYIAEWVKDSGKINECSMQLDNLKYNLTPIKKEWYEYPENFPTIIVSKTHEELAYKCKGYHKEHNCLLVAGAETANVDDWRPISKAELDSLYVGEE